MIRKVGPYWLTPQSSRGVCGSSLHSPRGSSTHTPFRPPFRRHATTFLVFETLTVGITDSRRWNYYGFEKATREGARDDSEVLSLRDRATVRVLTYLSEVISTAGNVQRQNERLSKESCQWIGTPESHEAMCHGSVFYTASAPILGCLFVTYPPVCCFSRARSSNEQLDPQRPV